MKPFNVGATEEFVPPARLAPPAYEAAELVVDAPGEVTQAAQTNLVIRYLPVLTALAAVAVTVAAFHSRSGVMRNPVFLLFPLTMLISAVATVASSADRRGGDINAERARYLRYLSDLRMVAVKNAAAQHDSLAWSHPEPEALWTLVGGCRMWERRDSDADFCRVRIGVGTQRLAGRIIAPTIVAGRQTDPVTLNAMQRFIDAHSTVADVPVTIALAGAVSVIGEPTRTRTLVRGMICQLAVMHSPKLVSIGAVVTEHSRSDWDWLKWLPHNHNPRAGDEIGCARLVYSSLAAAKRALSAMPMHPGLMLVVVDEGDGVSLFPLNGTKEVSRLRVTENSVAVELPTGETVLADPDQMSEGASLACAQRLAGYRASEMDMARADEVSWQRLTGIGDAASYSAPDCWRGRRPRDRLRVPVGTTADGAVVALDIKEAADSGMGPHGLCIGATGSGKSEFLRTVALGMIALHSPEVLNLILIDFKGGATFAGLEGAPHVAAVITNLSDKAALVSRMRDALTGEVNRRQELLRAAGNVDGIAAYECARQSRSQLSPLPALFVIVDEFSELLSQQPDFADVFAAIGRLGRSLGIHLLLASQRLDEGRLRGLESHLSYRVCLKTLSVNESRVVLGTSDAYELPTTPGAAYLRFGNDTVVRFHTAYVSGPCHPRTRIASQHSEMRVRLFTAEPVGTVTPLDTASGGDCPTVLETVVNRLSGYGPRAHEVWLPPLGAAPPLAAVLAEAEPMGSLTTAIGSVDRPFEQRRTPLLVDLSGAAGNVAIVGAPQSGKSTALRTLITALAVNHDPSMAQFYCLDFGGGALASMRDWPHVGSVAGRADAELARRMIAQIEAIIRSRAELFCNHRIESMAHYRQMKAQRDPVCDRFGDVFLVVDGWAALHREIESAENSISTIAAEGLSYGVHVVLSASRWAEVRPALRDQVGTRIELRLGDAADSELDRRRAHDVPTGQPGRGLSHEGLHMVIALPNMDGNGSSSDARFGEMLRRRHGGCSAPPIALLPGFVDYDSLVARSDTDIVLGLEDTELRTVAIDFTHQLHLLIIGDSECGKTAALRTVCRGLLRTRSPEQCQTLIVDVRRSLLDLVESEPVRLGGYLASVDAVGEAIPRLIAQLRRRMPPPDVTPAQLRTRSWWSGPEIYVVVDDYDLVGNLLAPFAELLPHARDLGFHLLLARRSRGAARAMFEPLLAGLRDAGCLTLLMSGSPDELLTVDSVRQSPMPPGRGMLVTRRRTPQLVQVAWSPSG